MNRTFFAAASVALGLGVLVWSGCAPDLKGEAAGGGGAGGAGGGTGGAPMCMSAADCGEESVCGKPACTVEKTCTWSEVQPEGAMPPMLTNVYGDCTKEQCNGLGQVVELKDQPDDQYIYGNPCLKPDCQMGMNANPDKNPSAACVFNPITKEMGKCDMNGACVKCTSTNECTAPNTCERGLCVPGSCKDGVKNGAETDVDCGGTTCPPCILGQACTNPNHCTTRRCVGNKCEAPDCGDSIKNGSETDEDCGGPDCAKCGVGKACNYGSDCTNSICVGGLCQ
jgi:hypothetical protein